MTQDYRFEIKIPIPLNRLEYMLSWLRLSSMGFRQHHPEQHVNSVYFDSYQMACFAENLTGISNRNKMRIRWYHDITNAGKAKLEFKQRRSGKGYKVIYPLQLNFDDPNISWSEHIKHCQSQLSLQALSEWDSQTYPILLGRYKRQYLISFCGRIRATLDSNMEVYDQRYWSKPNTNRSRKMGDYVLLELKCQAQHERLLSDLVSHCPLNPSRHSKYVNGVRHMIYV